MAIATSKTFEVRGFHCIGCSENLGSSLNNIDGVIRAQASFEGGHVDVRFDPNRVTEDDIKAQIRASGFDPD